MKTHNVILPFLILILPACLEEDYFGYSSYARIKQIEVSNQASQASIDQVNNAVEIEFPPGVDLSGIRIQSLKLSSFATSDKQPGDLLDMRETATIMVTAEDGSVSTWEIIPLPGNATPQLPNSDFNSWFKTGGNYFEPGTDAQTTVWGTGNPGTQILGLTATTPLEVEDDNFAARMETLDNGSLAGIFGAPISAGSIFTGKFNSDNVDPADPEAAIDFGTPFAGRPTHMELLYSYIPGPENKDKNGNDLSYGDQCDIYAYLEVRSSGQIKRLATAWFRSGETVETLESVTIEFVYGVLDNSYPDSIKPPDGSYVTGDSLDFILPTHITFVASSSFDGARFAGAVGSLLIIDDLELQYAE